MKKLFFEDYKVGFTSQSKQYVIDKNEMVEYAKKWDPLPVHIDEDIASKTPLGSLTAPGCYLMAIAIRLVYDLDINPQIRSGSLIAPA